MARIYPNDWKNLEATGAAAREIDTLGRLARALPAAYTVYHGVHWTRLNQGFAVFGEADFVVVGPTGKLMIVEQKAGFLRETPQGLVKIHLQKQKNVAVQLAHTVESLRRRLVAAFGEGDYPLEALLYCPDYTVRDAAIAGVDASRIVDATRKDRLPAIIQALLPADEARPAYAGRIHAFLSDHLVLTPDAGALVGQADTLVTRLAGGLATWARRLAFEPFRLRVIGTAGSGKTQLALEVMKDAVAAGRRPLYVCYNRPLADHIAQVAPEGATVVSYHQLSDRVLRDAGEAPTARAPELFAWLEERFAAATIPARWRFDVVVVDEGQDFEQPWVAALERLLAPGAAWWWLEDPMQNLYLRPAVQLPGWAVLHATTNFRSPRDILAYLRTIVPRVEIEAGSPFDGSDLAVTTYDASGAADATKRAITQALALGFRKQDIVVLSFHGRERSALSHVEHIGPHRLRSFTGRYDLFGKPEYRDGDVLFESIYRFKGQSAPCVIMTEIDFDHFDERVARKIFVGATRATLKLMMVMSTHAATHLPALFGPEAA